MGIRRVVNYGKHLLDNIITFLKWMAIGIFVGIIVGLVGVSFYKLLEHAGNLQAENPWLLYLLPVGGMVIAFL